MAGGQSGRAVARLVPARQGKSQDESLLINEPKSRPTIGCHLKGPGRPVRAEMWPPDWGRRARATLDPRAAYCDRATRSQRRPPLALLTRGSFRRRRAGRRPAGRRQKAAESLSEGGGRPTSRPEVGHHQLLGVSAPVSRANRPLVSCCWPRNATQRNTTRRDATQRSKETSNRATNDD